MQIKAMGLPAAIVTGSFFFFVVVVVPHIPFHPQITGRRNSLLLEKGERIRAHRGDFDAETQSHLDRIEEHFQTLRDLLEAGSLAPNRTEQVTAALPARRVVN